MVWSAPAEGTRSAEIDTARSELHIATLTWNSNKCADSARIRNTAIVNAVTAGMEPADILRVTKIDKVSLVRILERNYLR